jgi:hypothetical protein
VILNFNREPLLGVAGVTRADGIPAATPEQMEALDVIEALAKKHQLALSLDPGDLLFVNNLAVLHSREKFQDSPTEHRYLIRLWLRNEELAWKLPRPLELSNQVTFYDGEVQEIWNVAAHPRIKFSDLERFSP